MEERVSVFSSLWDVHRNFKGVISVQSELHGRFWRSNQRQLAGAWWTASASLVLFFFPLATRYTRQHDTTMEPWA